MSLLREYLKTHGISNKVFAQAIGIKPYSLSRYLPVDGKAKRKARGPICKPERPVAIAIERETNGAVPASSWDK